MEGGQFSHEANVEIGQLFKCKVCGAPLYATDQCTQETTYHCSSVQARFWEFERGSLEQIQAKDHWDQSREEIFSVKS